MLVDVRHPRAVRTRARPVDSNRNQEHSIDGYPAGSDGTLMQKDILSIDSIANHRVSLPCVLSGNELVDFCCGHIFEIVPLSEEVRNRLLH